MPTPKVVCERCAEPYPADLVRDFFQAVGGRVRVCGICALALAREVHGDGYFFAKPSLAREIYMRCLSIKTVKERVVSRGATK